MGQKRAIALSVKDGAIRFRGALPEAFLRYSPLLIDPRGNLYLLCEDRTKPMLKFLPGKNVFSRPDRQILLPATYRARFSQDGSLLIILSLDHNEKWTQSLWLWGTKNWQSLDANHHIHAAKVSLSASGSHWLISGRNGCLTETCHTQSNP